MTQKHETDSIGGNPQPSLVELIKKFIPLTRAFDPESGWQDDLCAAKACAEVAEQYAKEQQPFTFTEVPDKPSPHPVNKLLEDAVRELRKHVKGSHGLIANIEAYLKHGSVEQPSAPVKSKEEILAKYKKVFYQDSPDSTGTAISGIF